MRTVSTLTSVSDATISHSNNTKGNYNDIKISKKSQRPKKRRNCSRWDPEEDNLLMKAIEQYGERNWNAIATIVNTKTADQCNQHWYRVLNPRINKKPWNNEEDNLLRKAVANFGESSWCQVMHQLPNRTDIQCRHRWVMLKKALRDKVEAKGGSTTPSSRDSGDEDVVQVVIPKECSHQTPVIPTPSRPHAVPAQFMSTQPIAYHSPIPPQTMIPMGIPRYSRVPLYHPSQNFIMSLASSRQQMPLVMSMNPFHNFHEPFAQILSHQIKVKHQSNSTYNDNQTGIPSSLPQRESVLAVHKKGESQEPVTGQTTQLSHKQPETHSPQKETKAARFTIDSLHSDAEVSINDVN